MGSLDHSNLQSQRSADLKAALAANAAMIRSIQEEEKVFSAQRDLLERRRGEAGERRKGAEEHVSFGETVSCFAPTFRAGYLMETRPLWADPVRRFNTQHTSIPARPTVYRT